MKGALSAAAALVLSATLGRLGRQLVAQAPPELNRPEFESSFTAVNLKERAGEARVVTLGGRRGRSA